jgi:hypothetical protein
MASIETSDIRRLWTGIRRAMEGREEGGLKYAAAVRLRRLTVCFLLLIATPATALAQAGPEPLPLVVADLRGFYSGLGRDPVTAADLGLTPDELPGRALGAVASVQVYPLRRSSFAVGLGGEFLVARGRATREIEEEGGLTTLPPVEQRLRGLAGSLSLNFGHRDGWSYLSAGMGPLAFGSFVGESAPAEPAPRRNTINLGGGARWFVNQHLGVTFDVRFYLTRPDVTTASYPARERNRLVVLSGGISIR